VKELEALKPHSNVGRLDAAEVPMVEDVVHRGRARLRPTAVYAPGGEADEGRERALKSG